MLQTLFCTSNGRPYLEEKEEDQETIREEKTWEKGKFVWKEKRRKNAFLLLFDLSGEYHTPAKTETLDISTWL